MARKRVDPKTTPNAMKLTSCKIPNQERGSAPRHNKTIKMQNAEAKGVQPLLCETMNPGKPGEEGPEAHD